MGLISSVGSKQIERLVFSKGGIITESGVHIGTFEKYLEIESNLEQHKYDEIEVYLYQLIFI